MTSSHIRRRLQTAAFLGVIGASGVVWTTRHLGAQPGTTGAATLAQSKASYDQKIKPFLTKNCTPCHDTDHAVAGVRVDQMDANFEDRHIRAWEGIKKRLEEGTMPPKGMAQPTASDSKAVVDWISQGIEMARVRVASKKGLVRRLTVAQYRNTLRELLHLEDDLTVGMTPDAISKDGFVNNQETLNISPLQLESYLEVAEEALKRSMVDPKTKPWVQDFKLEMGAGVNPKPFPETLILGAGSALLDNKDVLITQPVPTKLFSFDPRAMRTKYRFIEGYQGNDTVRGWREYDSIYHAVFADMRGSAGYPKGKAYGTVPEGLLLRPSIPNDELFESDGTYGPKANFKISVRELPDYGRFRVTVMAARYNDGLLLETGAAPATAGTDAITAKNPSTPQSVTVAKAGIYQVDVHAAPPKGPIAPEAANLSQGLGTALSLNDRVEMAGQLADQAKFVESPFGKAVTFAGDKASVSVPRTEGMNVGTADFTVAAWIHPKQVKKAGLISLGEAGVNSAAPNHGWNLMIADPRGIFKLETTGPDNTANGTIASPRGALKADAWQHVAAVVRRGGKNISRLYVNGYQVAKGDIGAANLDNAKLNLILGRVQDGQQYAGEIDEVRLYQRALGEAEIQALVEPGKQFVKAPTPEKNQDITVSMGDRQFTGTLQQPAWMVVRLEAGALSMDVQNTGMGDLERVVLTPVAATQDLGKKFLAFEKRAPRLGVHMGFRRDCGSTVAPVGAPQTVSGGKLTKFVFEGAIRNYPNPEVEKDNVNYLAGVREMAIRSEFTDGRDMPRLLIRSVEFEGPFYDQWPPVSHKSLFIDSPNKGETSAYARDMLRNFATKAYRRPATPAEVTSVLGVYARAKESGRTFQESVREAMQVVLTSPQFLFITENSRNPEGEPLDAWELASKLSYFLWNGPPDQTTLRLAAAGTLRSQLDAEVTRMVNDAKFSRFTREFTQQWLNLDKFTVLEPDRKKFPQLTRDARVQLRDEPIQFVDYLMRKNLPVSNLVQSDFILANETVATYYGLGDKVESGFGFVAIPHGRKELGGVLTQAALMAGLSDGRESNPVKRGAWLARRIISEPPADPPPNVPTLKENLNLTLRERLEQHRNQPGCQQCHAKIDPWGVALEEFDAGGRLKQQPADAHSTLPDNTQISGANDLKKYLAQDRIDQVAFNVLRHLTVYGTGRNLSYNEVDYLKRDGQKLKADGYRMKDMVRYVVNSKMFLEK